LLKRWSLTNFLYHSSIRRNLTQVSGIFCRKQVNIVRLGSWCLDVLNRIVLRYNTSSFVAPPSCPTIILMGGLEWNTPAGPGRHDYQRNRIHILTCTNASTLQVKYKECAMNREYCSFVGVLIYLHTSSSLESRISRFCTPYQLPCQFSSALLIQPVHHHKSTITYVQT